MSLQIIWIISRYYYQYFQDSNCTILDALQVDSCFCFFPVVFDMTQVYFMAKNSSVQLVYFLPQT